MEKVKNWGYKRIAQQIALAFGVDIDKDVVRRILTIHFHPDAGSGGPSWLSFIGYAKDSLWSLDLFRCESAILHSYWVVVVMDQFTRSIVGFAAFGIKGPGHSIVSNGNSRVTCFRSRRRIDVGR